MRLRDVMKAKPKTPGRADSRDIARAKGEAAKGEANGREKETASESGERSRAWGGWLVIPAGMLVALCGGALMGGAAAMVSSGEVLGLIELYVSGAVTAVMARLVYRRGGMFSLSVYAALAGAAVILGPALTMWLSPGL